MRTRISQIHDGDFDPRQTQAALNVLNAIGGLLAIYEDFETFALRIMYEVQKREAQE